MRTFNFILEFKNRVRTSLHSNSKNIYHSFVRAPIKTSRLANKLKVFFFLHRSTELNRESIRTFDCLINLNLLNHFCVFFFFAVVVVIVETVELGIFDFSKTNKNQYLNAWWGGGVYIPET